MWAFQCVGCRFEPSFYPEIPCLFVRRIAGISTVIIYIQIWIVGQWLFCAQTRTESTGVAPTLWIED
jgi:hypothetical protein